MKDNVRFDLPINEEQLSDERRILDGVRAATVHSYIVMMTAGFDQSRRKFVPWSDGVHFMPLFQKGSHKTHPEIVYIPGGVEY
jgi:hypothetical protein